MYIIHTCTFHAVCVEEGALWFVRCLTFCSGTISFSGDTMERMSLVIIGGAPGSGEGVVPNSRLGDRKNWWNTCTSYAYAYAFPCTWKWHRSIFEGGAGLPEGFLSVKGFQAAHH